MEASWQSFIDYMIERGSIDELMIISSETGGLYASSDNKSFYLREYKAMITQEDGNEKEETVNEANNILAFMKGSKPSQGLRINGKKKQQITRSFKDEETGLQIIYSKMPQGGACIANAGKCILIGTFDEAKGHTSPPLNETITLIARYLNKSVWPNRNDGESSNDDDNGGGGGGDSGAAVAASSSAPTWQAYIDTMLVGKGNVAHAMIIDCKTGKLLASTLDFQLKTYETEIAQEDGTDKVEMVNEYQNITKLVKGSRGSQGLRINKVKYQIVKSAVDENSGCYSVYGKKSMGGCGVVDCNNKCLLICTFDETKMHNAAGLQTVLSDLAKYLKDNLK